MESSTQMRFAGTTGSSICVRCRRALKTPESRARGAGPVCAAKMEWAQATADAREARNREAETDGARSATDGDG